MAKGNVPDQSALLSEIHELNKTSKVEESLFLKQVADFAEGELKLDEPVAQPSVLLRFYIRVVEKMNRKLTLYANHRRHLHFLTFNIVRIWRIKEFLAAGEGIKDLRLFVDIMGIIVRENQQLQKLLLDLIVSENFVSSVEEFNNISAAHGRRRKSSRHSLLGLYQRSRKSNATQESMPSSS